MKQVLAGLLSVMLVFGAFIPATLAEEAPVTTAAVEDTAGTDIAEVEPAYISTWGTITKVDVANKQLTVNLGETKEDIVLNITSDTYIVDNLSRKAVALKDLKENDVVYVWHSPIMTMSLPPQTKAIALAVNVPADMASGRYFEVEKIEKTSNGYRLLNQEQDLFVTVPANTKINVFNSNKKVDISRVKPGTKLMVWYEIAAASFPAQAGTAELIMFEYDYKGYVSVEGEKIVVNGGTLSRKAITKDGTVYVPMQDIAQKLSFTASYRSSTKTLTVRRGAERYVFTAGNDYFVANKSDVATSAPFVENNRLYVEVSALNFLGNYKLAMPVR